MSGIKLKDKNLHLVLITDSRVKQAGGGGGAELQMERPGKLHISCSTAMSMKQIKAMESHLL